MITKSPASISHKCSDSGTCKQDNRTTFGCFLYNLPSSTKAITTNLSLSTNIAFTKLSPHVLDKALFPIICMHETIEVYICPF